MVVRQSLFCQLTSSNNGTNCLSNVLSLCQSSRKCSRTSAARQTSLWHFPDNTWPNCSANSWLDKASGSSSVFGAIPVPTFDLNLMS
jgi:hypothetical protein